MSLRGSIARARGYLFDLKEDRSGRTLPYTRFDIILSVLMALVLLGTVAFVTEISSAKNAMRLGALMLAGLTIWLISPHRKLVCGAASGIVAFRSCFGVLMSDHPLPFLVLTLASGATAWFLLKDQP